MRIKLDEDNRDTKSFRSERFNRAEVFKMVNDFRKPTKPNKDLWYSHFSLDEILQLCIDNGVLDENKSIKDQLADASQKGLKFYVGKHPNNLQAGYAKYNEHTTIIACNTIIISKTDYKFKDLLQDKKNTVAICMPTLSPDDEALDMTNICPPDCVKDEDYDIGQCQTC